MSVALNNISTHVEKPTIIAKLEQGQQYIPATIRLAAAIIQESLAELVSTLLMIGLILSMSNFLLAGAVFKASAAIPVIWVIVQCIAIDANMGVMLTRSIKNFHASEYGKGFIYLVIALALLFVAAIILDVEAVQEVINKSLNVIFGNLHINIEILTFVRSSAVVALVAATQLEHVSLRRSKATAAVAPVQTEPTQGQGEGEGEYPSIFELRTLGNSINTAITQLQALQAGQGEGTATDTDELAAINIAGKQRERRIIIVADEQHEKLLRAWKTLSPQGHLSIRQLQRAAGVRREVAAYWFNNECWKDEIWHDIPSTPGVNESEAIA